MNEIMNADFYSQIRDILEAARNRVYASANSAMVQAYWNIGKKIVEQQGGAERAEYGTKLIKDLSRQLTADFGKGFTVTNLKYMRQFYLAFPTGHTLCDQMLCADRSENRKADASGHRTDGHLHPHL